MNIENAKREAMLQHPNTTALPHTKTAEPSLPTNQYRVTTGAPAEPRARA